MFTHLLVDRKVVEVLYTNEILRDIAIKNELTDLTKPSESDRNGKKKI